MYGLPVVHRVHNLKVPMDTLVAHNVVCTDGFKEYSLEVRAELPQTIVADSQPSPRAGRPKGLVLSI